MVTPVTGEAVRSNCAPPHVAAIFRPGSNPQVRASPMAHNAVAATRRILHEWARTPRIALLPGGSAAARGCAQTAKTAEPASRMGTYAAGWAAKELRPPFCSNIHKQTP
jgi:hypothetical protein